MLDFRNRSNVRKLISSHTFDTPEYFQKLLHKLLAAWLREGKAPGEEGGGIEPASPTSEVATEIPASLDEPGDSSTAKAWALADEGRVTEAEVAFAKNVVGRHQPRPLIEHVRFLVRLGRLIEAAVLFDVAFGIAQEQSDDAAVAAAYGKLGNVLATRPR